MKNPALTFFLSAAALLLIFLSANNVHAQERKELAAKAALINVANRYGADQVQWIVELRGFYGQPQPKEWEIVVHDPKMPNLVHEYWAGPGGDVSDEGPSNDFYPKRSPSGFIRLSDLKLDSRAAFTVAEGEARKAKISFNSLNFYLRAREYSREPIWTLELLDIDEKMVGKVYISGGTGEVLRTVWIYQGDRGGPGGKPVLVDSASPQAGGAPGAEPRSTSSTTSNPTPDSPLGGLPPIPPAITRIEPDPLGPKPPVAPEDGPTVTRIPEPPAPVPLPVPPPNGGGPIDTKIPPPPVPRSN